MDKEIQNIISKLKYGDRNEIREAKLAINKLWNANSKSFDRHALAIFNEAKNFDLITNPVNQAAMVEALYFPYLSLADRKYFLELSNFIIKAAVHQNGNVRKAAVNLVTWLRCDIVNNNNAASNLEYKLFLQNIDKLIEKYKHEAPEARYISEIKTSVYKSLRVLRQESARGLFAEQIANLPELAAATKKNEGFFDEPEDSNPLPEILAHDATRHSLESLYKDIKSRVLREIAGFGFTERDIIYFESFVVRDPLVGDDDSNTTNGFLKFFDKYMRKYPKAQISSFNPLARALQAVSNHYVKTLVNGKSASNFLVNIITVRWENYRHKPDNFENLACLIKDSHEKIDTFLNKEQAWLNKEFEDFQSRMIKFGLPPEELMGYKTHKFHPQYSSVAHHILDWYIQISPWEANHKTSEKLAALAIYLTEKINFEAGFIMGHYLNKEHLAEFGGWKGKRGLYSSVAYSPFYDVIRNVHDPDLLLLDSEKVPKNWREKLGLPNDQRRDRTNFDDFGANILKLMENDEMPPGAFIPFSARHLEESQKEIISIVVKENNFDVRPGLYLVVENYCIKDDCDCRKAMLNICNPANSRIMATISYGWENREHYINWSDVDEPYIREMAGSYLEPGGVQSEQAETFLEMWRSLVSENPDYKDQIKRHYDLFKGNIGTSIRNNIKLGRNDPCWCKSGKKYKRCHGA